jgi:hypothetical protein
MQKAPTAPACARGSVSQLITKQERRLIEIKSGSTPPRLI